MFRTIRRFRSLLAPGLLAVIPFAAGLPAYPAVAAAATPLTSVNWKNFSYTSSCFSSSPLRFVARNGLAVTNHIHFQVYTPLYGDLTGNGQLAAIVPYSCTAADFGGVHLYVYAGTASKPKLLGQIPAPGAPYAGSINSVTAVTLPITLMGNVGESPLLQVTGIGYSANAPHTCPDLLITSRFQIHAGALKAISSTKHKSSTCLNGSATPSMQGV